jgi:uncharacterized protein (DUF885 family)
MTHLARLTFKSVAKAVARDPIIARRDKLMAALEEQKSVLAAALEGQDRITERSKWMVNSDGHRVLVKTQRRVKPWFFEQDGGWYVQCRYGARVIAADGKNNAVFVKSLKEVDAVLDAFIAATAAGELDGVISAALGRKSTKAKEVSNG